jgi:hypothetical protein
VFSEHIDLGQWQGKVPNLWQNLWEQGQLPQGSGIHLAMKENFFQMVRSSFQDSKSPVADPRVSKNVIFEHLDPARHD